MVRGSVLGRNVIVGSQSSVEDSIVLDNCTIGRDCRVRHAILDENVVVPDGTRIGYDLGDDRIHHHVSGTGIVVVTSGSIKGS